MFNPVKEGPHPFAPSRLCDGADLYFVSNQRRQYQTVECAFRVSGKAPELWDPQTGSIMPAPIWREENGRTLVTLSFDPAGSIFVVFRSQPPTDHVVAVKINLPPGAPPVEKPDDLRIVKAGYGAFSLRKVVDVTTKIAALVDGGHLSVTANNDLAGVKFFSGTATYQTDLEIPDPFFAPGREVWLDLGDVKNFAEVSVNNQPFGVLWKPPFRVNISRAVRPGANTLQVKVTNLWPNRLIGDELLPADCQWNSDGSLKSWPQWLLDGQPSPTGRVTFTTWHHWKKTDALLDSGLLGPVTLRAVQEIDLR